MADYEFTSEGVDDIDEDVSTPKEMTVLDRLRAEIQQEVELPLIEIRIPKRRDISITLDPNQIGQESLKAWRKRAGEGSNKGLNTLQFATIVLGNTTTQIAFDGVPVEDDNGTRLTFASQPIIEMANASDPYKAIRWFFGVDAHIEAAALEALDAAGYGDSIERIDPTDLS